MNQMIIVKLLKSLGYNNVTKAGDGQQAIDAVEQTEFDIILMDCMMPNVSGIEATEAIRNRSDIKQPIIIALTADAFKDNVIKCLEVA